MSSANKPIPIKAALATGTNSPLEVVELELAPPREGEVRVQIEATGICASDVNDWRDQDAGVAYPAVYGHEAAGIVEDVPAKSRFSPGDRVILNWSPACGTCEPCTRGYRHLCSTVQTAMWSGTMFDGTSRLSRDGQLVHHYGMLSTFATHTVVPEMACVPLMDEVPFDVASLVGCAVPTGAAAAWNTVKVAPGDPVAIFGCGGVGLSAMLGAICAGATPVIAVDIVESRLQKARELGATNTIAWAGDAEETAALVRDASGGGVDYAFETAGRPEASTAAILSTRMRGTTVLIGLPHRDAIVPLQSKQFLRVEKKIVGAEYGSCFPQEDFPRILKLYKAGLLPIDKLITHRLPLSRIHEGFDLLISGEAVRTVINMSL